MKVESKKAKKPKKKAKFRNQPSGMPRPKNNYRRDLDHVRTEEIRTTGVETHPLLEPPPHLTKSIPLTDLLPLSIIESNPLQRTLFGRQNSILHGRIRN